MKPLNKTLFHTPRGRIKTIMRFNGVYKPCIAKLNTQKGHKRSLSQPLFINLSLPNLSHNLPQVFMMIWGHPDP